MEALLPSEIARLVLGYLQDQKCTEAAKLFLETSPHLQECRTVISNGRRFSTRVSGLTLIDVFEKFSAISGMIQDRINKATDCEQLKHCGDLLEQLRFLVEESKGQRFVVNINVPSQSNQQVPGSSPILPSSSRKRRHSNCDRERCKRGSKSISQTSESSESLPNQLMNYQAVEATPLESLPGHISRQTEQQQSKIVCENVTGENTDNTVSKNNQDDESDGKTSESKLCQNGQNEGEGTDNTETKVDDNEKQTQDVVIDNIFSSEKCTAATSTEELLSFSNMEVQTTPYDMHESESETNDEPIENLSLLTKELLNRTELQERIAENINKAILPTEISLREEVLNESMGGEMNTSIMVEINNAVKSIVEATESDPIFEKFLDDIIGHVETDTSPDEDGEMKIGTKSDDGLHDKNLRTVKNNNCSEYAITQNPNEGSTAEVPLKHRLRSSSRQQTARVEDDVDKFKDQEKDNALEDQNAEAILSIINANLINNCNEVEGQKNDGTKELSAVEESSVKPTVIEPLTTEEKNLQTTKPLLTLDTTKINNLPVNSGSTNTEPKVKKTTIKRPRATKPKREEANNFITEQEIMTMPTLIVCSKEEISSFLTMNPSYPTNTVRSVTSTSSSHFIPIAPKDHNRMNEKKVDTLYLRAVNVAQRVPKSVSSNAALDSKNSLQQKVMQPTQSKKTNTKTLNVVQTTGSNVQCITQSTSTEFVETNKFIGTESITLYSNENSTKTLLDSSNMPAINIDENINLSGTGLSPYFKYNNSKTIQSHNLSDIDLTSVMETIKTVDEPLNYENSERQASKSVSREIITKRTPRSLLKSRSKNNRLSLSTPRRRSNHIRALDFSTPPKSAMKVSENENLETLPNSANLKSMCRTSLFKSPPFSNSQTSFQRAPSPVKLSGLQQVPIATRSPAPKLVGGWDKCNGVGVIIGDMPPINNAPSATSDVKKPLQRSKLLRDSWDADLRKIAQLNSDEDFTSKKNEGAKSKRTARKAERVKHLKPKNTKKASEKNSVTSTKQSDSKEIPLNKESVNTIQKEINIQEPVKTEEPKICDNNETFLKNIITTDTTFNKNENLDTQNSNKTETLLQFPKDLVTSTPAKIDSVNTSKESAEKKPVKKYAQLKTISTNIRKPEPEQKQDTENVKITVDVTQNSQFSKTSEVSQHLLQLPNMIELETPRKLETPLEIPPTPRLLSPSSNIITPFTKLCDESSKIRSFISTPEFPKTPCIALTPKYTEENTIDQLKKSDFNSCSPYYKPISEQIKNPEKLTSKDSSASKGNVSSSTTSSHTSQSVSSIENGYQSTAKLEITQFEVIKENLPKEEADKELKISCNPKDVQSDAKLQATHSQNIVTTTVITESKTDQHEIANNSKSFTETESTDTDSSSSSDSTSSSSSSSSSSYSSSSKSSVSVPFSSVKKPKKALTKIYTDTSNDSILKNTKTDDGKDSIKGNCNVAQSEPKTIPIVCSEDNVSSLKDTILPSNIEKSPIKVLPLIKTEEQLKETQKETPAKDEALLEADISETPSSSKAGIETLTNLSSKISAFISAEDDSVKVKTKAEIVNKVRQKPRIIDVQHISKPIPVKTSQSSHAECDVIKSQLEEKRQRMMAKFREEPNSTRGKSYNKKCTLTTHNKASMLRKANLLNKKKLAQNSNNYLVNKVKQPLKKVNPRPDKKQLNTNDEEKNNELEKQDILRNNENNNEVVDTETQNNERVETYCDNVETIEEKEAKIQNKNSNSNLDIKREIKRRSGGVEKEKECQKTCSINSDNIDNNIAFVNPNKDNTEVKEISTGDSKQSVVPENVRSELEKLDATETEEHQKSKARDYITNVKKSSTLKSKVDQVKRDLFSDEESDKKPSHAIANVPELKRNDKDVSVVNKSCDKQKSTAENLTSKEELSSVLQCLQLVPAYKNNVDESNENILDTSTPNDVHYNFVYEDSTPIRKRRRRYSNHELEFQIHIPNYGAKECFKVMKPTDYEEIFNIPPKSRKRISKKSPVKNEAALDKNKNNFCLKNVDAKPLATSSPLIKSPVQKIKKANNKNPVTNDDATHLDVKKKQKNEKIGETSKDQNTKIRKRKLSESKESKQTEKRQRATDPQTLLSNLDLDEFLTTVHGPA